MRRILQSSRFWAFLVISLGALVGFSSMFVQLRGIFGDVYEDMSHGWLVPFFSLYVLWAERNRLKDAVEGPSFWGFLACIPCVLVALVGARGFQVRLEQLGFIGLCITVPWALWGRKVAKLCVFPALFLLFTVPLTTYLAGFTVRLRLLASSVACSLLRGFGMDAVQVGTVIAVRGEQAFKVDVEAGCSGLRSLFALVSLTAAYSWFTQPTWWRRGALFVCAVPLAVCGNVVRILSICLVAAWKGTEFALGTFHDGSGYVVFIVAIVLMVACGELINRFAGKWKKGRTPESEKDGAHTKEEPEDRREDVEAETRPADGFRVLFHVVPWLTAVVLLAAFAFQTRTPDPKLMEAPKIVLPTELPGGFRGEEVFFCQNAQCAQLVTRAQPEKGREGVCPHCGGELGGMALAEARILPADTQIFKRLYQSPSGTWFLVSAIVGGVSKSSLHRPELCMPAQGYLIRGARDFEVEGRPFHSMRLESPYAPPAEHVYTFFDQNGRRTASHLRRNVMDTWARSVSGRIDRWVMVTVTARRMDGFSLERPLDRQILMEFLSGLSKELP